MNVDALRDGGEEYAFMMRLLQHECALDWTDGLLASNGTHLETTVPYYWDEHGHEALFGSYVCEGDNEPAARGSMRELRSAALRLDYCLFAHCPSGYGLEADREADREPNLQDGHRTYKKLNALMVQCDTEARVLASLHDMA